MLRSTFTLAALTLIVGSIGACRGNRSEEPPVHLVQNMDFQERNDPQEYNGFFADGRAMRKPPEGTVAVGNLEADDHLYRGLALDGTMADSLPEQIELNETLLARGRERYNIYCAPCHAETGYGNGPAVRRGGFTVEPANLHMQKLHPAPLGYLYEVITNGKGQMRPYKAQIVAPEDRWAIAAWVRTLQLSHLATRDQVPAQARGQGSAR